VLERWYDFESKATKRALREWCAFNSMELADDACIAKRATML
jgi:hypothetical protein